jgi:hypothetical protein
MMAVEVETKPTFRAGKSRMLFEGRYFDAVVDGYDVAPDG